MSGNQEPNTATMGWARWGKSNTEMDCRNRQVPIGLSGVRLGDLSRAAKVKAADCWQLMMRKYEGRKVRIMKV